MPQAVGLVGDGLDQVGVAVAKQAGAEPGEQVEVGVAIGVVEVAALATLDHDGAARVGQHHVLVVAVDRGLGLGGGQWGFLLVTAS